ncbi:MAG: acetyl-CoA decarbonylase/synthase complex subunit gamma [Planctomycetota bacterium]
MALTGMDIYKLLPQTNCGDCGNPTCLAFAMQVASKQTSVEECPHISDEALEELGSASQPPQKLVSIGPEGNRLEIGNETVMFRHEEKFHNQPGIAVTVRDTDDVSEKADRIAALHFEHMGEDISVDTVALVCDSEDEATFTDAAKKLADELNYPMVLIADTADLLCSAAEEIADAKPLLWEREGPSDELVECAADNGLPVVVEGDLEECDSRTPEVKEAGVEEIVLCPGNVSPAESLEFLTISRRAALKETHRPLGYPVLIRSFADSPERQSMEGVHATQKYAGIVALDPDSPEYILPILIARQSVYIDPQVPVQVEEEIHAVGEPDAESPLLVTTNFALTFYSVLSETEASHTPARILPVDTEGTSVLTAWAAGEFGGSKVADAIKDSGVMDELDDGYRNPVIPGLVAVISGELEEELGEEVIVGPREASGIPVFINEEWEKMVG